MPSRESPKKQNNTCPAVSIDSIADMGHLTCVLTAFPNPSSQLSRLQPQFSKDLLEYQDRDDSGQQPFKSADKRHTGYTPTVTVDSPMQAKAHAKYARYTQLNRDIVVSSILSLKSSNTDSIGSSGTYITPPKPGSQCRNPRH